MAVNKVVFGAVSIMDISDSTVTQETLAEGETAYQSNGEKITGTMKSGVDTSDATVTANDMAEGVTAYGADGKKITGTIPVGKPVNKSNEPEIYTLGTTLFRIKCVSSASSDVIVRRNTEYYVAVDADKIGDALASDVAKGKTFTSSAGVKVVGTREESGGGGGQVKTGTTTSTTINTGLSKIDKLIIYAESLSGKGAIDIIYTGESEAVVTYCSYYSNYSKPCAVQKRSAFGVSGGTFEWHDTGSYAFAGGVTYHWIAFGS